jgi:hypothetical protein
MRRVPLGRLPTMHMRLCLALCALATARGFPLHVARANARISDVSNAMSINKLHAFLALCLQYLALASTQTGGAAHKPHISFASTCANMLKQELSKSAIVPLMRMEHDAGSKSTTLNLRLKRAVNGLREAQAYSKPVYDNLFQRECISQLQKGLESRRCRKAARSNYGYIVYGMCTFHATAATYKLSLQLLKNCCK